MTSHSCYSQFQGSQRHTPLDMEIFVFFLALFLLLRTLPVTVALSQAQCCSLEMRAEDTSQNLSFHLSNSSLYHEQPRADHIVQGTKKEEDLICDQLLPLESYLDITGRIIWGEDLIKKIVLH